MAILHFTGGALKVAKAMSATPDEIDEDDVFELLVGGITVATYTVGVVETAQAVVEGLQASWQANKSAHPYSALITATEDDSVVTLTSDIPGMDFVVTSSVTDGAGGNPPTLTMATPTANAGPNDWRSPENFSAHAVPVAADVVHLKESATDICWGLDQSAIDLSKLVIWDTYSGRIGLDVNRFATSADGRTYSTVQVPEYRDDYLKIGWDSGWIGKRANATVGVGSDRLKLRNDKAGAADTYIYHTSATPAERSTPVLQFCPTNVAQDIYISGGDIGIDEDAPGAETATCDTVSLMPEAGRALKLTVGAGADWVSLTQWGGTSLLNRGSGTAAILSIHGGSMTTEGVFYKIATTNVFGGVLVANNDNTVGPAITTDANVYSGTLDMSRISKPRSVTDLYLKEPGAAIRMNDKVIITRLHEPADRKSTITVT